MFEGWTDEAFAAWFAGFFDGEGCIYIPKDSGIGLTVANTNEAIIRAIHERIQLGVVCTITFSNPKWKTKFTWEVKRYDEAFVVLNLIRPFLTIKAAKADLAMIKIRGSLERRQKQLDRNRAIVDAVAAGKMHKTVAAEFGVNRNTVTQIVVANRKHGGTYTFRKRPPRRSLSSHETVRKLPATVTTKQTSRTSSDHHRS